MRNIIIGVSIPFALAAVTIFGGFYALDDTEWSDGFSESGFEKAQVGMTKEEVQGLIGQPISVWFRTERSNSAESVVEVWSYTRSPNDSHFAVRQVEFDSNQQVRDKLHSYWWE